VQVSRSGTPGHTDNALGQAMMHGSAARQRRRNEMREQGELETRLMESLWRGGKPLPTSEGLGSAVKDTFASSVLALRGQPQWGNRKHGFSMAFDATCSAALEIWLKLLYSNIQSFVACPLTAKYLTFSDCEWLEYPIYIILHNTIRC